MQRRSGTGGDGAKQGLEYEAIEKAKDETKVLEECGINVGAHSRLGLSRGTFESRFMATMSSSSSSSSSSPSDPTFSRLRFNLRFALGTMTELTSVTDEAILGDRGGGGWPQLCEMWVAD
jgi:hypothetical protein